MIECLNPEVRDSLPDLVHGRLGNLDTATLTAHVESCEACAAEVALLREVRAAAPIAPAIDVARIVAALPASGRVPASIEQLPQRSILPGRQSVIWKLVAAAAIVIGGTLAVDAGRTRVEPASDSSALSLIAGVQYLTDEQIETLLADLDAIEPLPAAEPEPAVIVVDNVGGSQ